MKITLLHKRIGNFIRNTLVRILYPRIIHGSNFHFKLSCLISPRVECISCGHYVGIGPRSIFMSNVHIGNFVIIGPEVKFLNKQEHKIDLIGKDFFHAGCSDLSEIIIEDDVWIGCSAIILGPCKVGRGSIVAAGSLVNKDVPPYTIVGGNPAKHIRERFSSSEILEHETRLKDTTYLHLHGE